MKRLKNPDKAKKFISEEIEWLLLSPAERILETTKLWRLYLALGGSLDPEPDPQSPFYAMMKNFRSAKKTLSIGRL